MLLLVHFSLMLYRTFGEPSITEFSPSVVTVLNADFVLNTLLGHAGQRVFPQP